MAGNNKKQKSTDGAVEDWDYLFYLLFEKYRMTALSFSLLSISLFLAMVPWAMYTGVWYRIDYPLNESYVTWIGDIFLGIANYFIAQYYIMLLQTPSSYKPRYRYVWPRILFISFLVSILFHSFFLADSLHGWTEINATDGWSRLGYYHIILFWAELFIVSHFIISIGAQMYIQCYMKSTPKTQISSIFKRGLYAIFFISIYWNIWIMTMSGFIMKHLIMPQQEKELVVFLLLAGAGIVQPLVLYAGASIFLCRKGHRSSGEASGKSSFSTVGFSFGDYIVVMLWILLVVQIAIQTKILLGEAAA